MLFKAYISFCKFFYFPISFSHLPEQIRFFPVYALYLLHFFTYFFVAMIFNSILVFAVFGTFIAYILLETICKDVKFIMATMIEQIEAVLDKHVRPSLASHQGDVVIADYTDDVLRIRLTGKCSGCPSAQLTTEELIAATVKEHLPQVKDVILVSGVSDELIAQAKALLHDHHL